MVKVGVIGANGYGGVELLRLLKQHPLVSVEKVISHSTQGCKLTEQYPHLNDVFEMTLEKIDIEEIASNVDLLFFATPSGVSKEIIPPFLERKVKCIDLSGDFRLKDGLLYEKWYKNTQAKNELLQNATYGLTELFRSEIKNGHLIANPGCYPTATILGVYPALKAKWIDQKSIIIDGKSGISGAGRNASIGNIFAEINENMKAYKIGLHQHIPEIEQLLNVISGEEARISFTTHLVPMTRGIMCTIYGDLKVTISTQKMIDLYKETYKDEYFVRIRSANEWPATKEVTGSNFCDIGLRVDERTNRLVIVSVIDNLVKGAAGQAIQNMNVINAWHEKTGLANVPLYP
ncbi:N-acetyl-gamma-glutamyl-phosphate reductase [Heyndrickxia sporothermodurans]|uniref:N-acetyl-gamma-glutamyl-phosphate reductase n=1 Tax=Heyndrickxia sporothermodurans TaxID=46224 RepID=A0A150KQK9_9BACI|nr:N-acetyl-gamma-glutamyl-phosphate reductase [Heyndrickxia sporothermodurans]KYD00135.1 N-acetyl-gamma-glutamyl-phosphate reductase [Heyndrickxia sporothermodurans]